MTPEGLALVKHFEGCRLSAYRDIVGVWTIGYGSTTGVFDGQTISQAQADGMLETELDFFRMRVSALCVGDGTDFQIDAMTALSYNIGINGFAASSVLRFHRHGDYPTAADCFRMWNRAGGQVVQGLVNRREAERKLYLTGLTL